MKIDPARLLVIVDEEHEVWFMLVIKIEFLLANLAVHCQADCMAGWPWPSEED